jgi:hypothetical protein
MEEYVLSEGHEDYPTNPYSIDSIQHLAFSEACGDYEPDDNEEESELDIALEQYYTPFDEEYAVASNEGSVDKNPYAPNTKAYTQWLSGFWAGFDE